jgi:hypothetical protein
LQALKEPDRATLMDKQTLVVKRIGVELASGWCGADVSFILRLSIDR